MASQIDINIFMTEDNHVIEKFIHMGIQEIWVSYICDDKVNEIN